MTQNHYQVSISEVFSQESWSGGFRTGRPRRFGAVLGRKPTSRCLKCQKHQGSRRLLVYTLEEMFFSVGNRNTIEDPTSKAAKVTCFTVWIGARNSGNRNTIGDSTAKVPKVT